MVCDAAISTGWLMRINRFTIICIEHLILSSSEWMKHERQTMATREKSTHRPAFRSRIRSNVENQINLSDFRFVAASDELPQTGRRDTAHGVRRQMECNALLLASYCVVYWLPTEIRDLFAKRQFIDINFLPRTSASSSHSTFLSIDYHHQHRPIQVSVMPNVIRIFSSNDLYIYITHRNCSSSNADWWFRYLSSRLHRSNNLYQLPATIRS